MSTIYAGDYIYFAIGGIFSIIGIIGLFELNSIRKILRRIYDKKGKVEGNFDGSGKYYR